MHQHGMRCGHRLGSLNLWATSVDYMGTPATPPGVSGYADRILPGKRRYAQQTHKFSEVKVAGGQYDQLAAAV